MIASFLIDGGEVGVWGGPGGAGHGTGKARERKLKWAGGIRWK